MFEAWLIESIFFQNAIIYRVARAPFIRVTATFGIDLLAQLRRSHMGGNPSDNKRIRAWIPAFPQMTSA